MPKPTDISSEQLRVRPGQRQAIVESVEKPFSGNPVPLLDEGAVHGSELNGRASEAQYGNSRPNAQGLAQTQPVRSSNRNVFGRRLQGLPFLRD